MFYFKDLRFLDKGRRTQVETKPFFHYQVTLNPRGKPNIIQSQFGLTLIVKIKLVFHGFC